MDDPGKITSWISELSHNVIGLKNVSRYNNEKMRILTLSQPSNAHSPAYNATAHELALVLVPSNHPIFFQSWFGFPS